MKKLAVNLLKIAVSIAILSYLVWEAQKNDEFTDVWNAPKQWHFILLAQIFIVAGIATSFWRWFGLVRGLDLPLKRLDALRIGFVGHLFGVFSIGTFGIDAVRVFYVARENPQQKTAAFITVFVDRMCGLLGLFMITTIALFLMQFTGTSKVIGTEAEVLKTITRIVLICTVCGLAGFASLFVLPYVSQWQWVRRLRHARFVGGIFSKTLDAGLAYKSQPMILVYALLQSLLVHCFLTLSVFCMAVGLSGSHPSLGDHFIISPIAHLPNVLPLPGGIGGLEYALNYFYAATLGTTTSYGLIVALGYRITSFVAALIGVFFYLKGRALPDLDSLQIEPASNQKTEDLSPESD